MSYTLFFSSCSHHRKPHADYAQADRPDRVSTPTHEFPEDEELLGDIKPIDKEGHEGDVHMDFAGKGLLLGYENSAL